MLAPTPVVEMNWRGWRSGADVPEESGGFKRRRHVVGAGYDPPVRYPVEAFTADERALLAPHFTNLDRPVFALVNLPETIMRRLAAEQRPSYNGAVRAQSAVAIATAVQPSTPSAEIAQAAGRIVSTTFITAGIKNTPQSAAASAT